MRKIVIVQEEPATDLRLFFEDPQTKMDLIWDGYTVHDLVGEGLIEEPIDFVSRRVLPFALGAGSYTAHDVYLARVWAFKITNQAAKKVLQSWLAQVTEDLKEIHALWLDGAYDRVNIAMQLARQVGGGTLPKTILDEYRYYAKDGYLHPDWE